jgi:ABC-type Zn uptake system ZnuABC Zn-binding protein ZnuA/ABC-type Mn2+/Zn2+ transport system permease subunit
LAAVLEPFQLPFVQRGLVEVVVLALAGGVIGTFIVLRGLAFYSHAVGTAAFPGLVLAGGLGFTAVLGAGATAAVVAVGVALLARRAGARERYDSITALVLVGALAAGVILASDVFHSGADVDSLLFGSLLLVDRGDIVFAAVAAVAVLGAAALLEQRWVAIGFDPAAARALGSRSGLPDAVLLALVALVAVAALSTLGALLATALLVVPAATTRLLCARLRTWQVATVALVAVEGTAGLWLSVQTNAPPGATIAVLGGAAFAAVAGRRALWRARRRAAVVALASALGLAAAGCGAGAGPAGPGQVQVVATTTQIADLARAVGGERAHVVGLLRPNTDPHEYEPRPSDVRDTATAKLVLLNGDDLDRWMGDVVEQSGTRAAIVDLGARVPVRLPGENRGPEASRYDPHWWHDPRNAEAAAVAIRDALTKANPDAAGVYARNARAYLARLRALDRGIARCMATVPRAARKLVTDHDAFGYFAHRYGIEVVGAVIPSQTTLAQPSARDVARLSALIEREHVRAVFPERSVNANLARAIARQTGATSDLTLYGDTLGPAGSNGATYLTMEEANADAMVRGFTGGARGCRIAGL